MIIERHLRVPDLMGAASLTVDQERQIRRLLENRDVDTVILRNPEVRVSCSHEVSFDSRKS